MLFLSNLIFLFFILEITNGLKILIFNPKFGGSHVGFMGKIADTLADTGHEVVVYQPVMNEKINFTGSKNKAIRYYTTPKNPDDYFSIEERQDNLWESESLAKLKEMTLWFRDTNELFCKNILRDTETLQKLKEENFDLGISEIFASCGFGVFKFIGLEKYIAASSSAMMSIQADLLGLKPHLSYVPSLFSLGHDKMTFIGRISNYLVSFVDYIWSRTFLIDKIDQAIQEKIPGFNLEEAIADAAFHFINSDELIDYPQPITHKVIYIGGLGKSQSQPLAKEYTEIFNSAKKGVIYFSLGSLVHSSHMNPETKHAFLDAFAEFPEINFIWKYENNEDEIAKDNKNIFTKKWLPQNDLLDHPRLLAFISHGGMNSVIEGTSKGVPMICIPIFGDQYHNAVMLERRGTGVTLQKDTLTKEKIVEAINKIIGNEKYKKKAKILSKLISTKPMSSAERVIKYTEFAANFDEIETLQTEGKNHSWFILNSLDVILTLIFGFFVFVTVAFLIVRKILRMVIGKFLNKRKVKKS